MEKGVDEVGIELLQDHARYAGLHPKEGHERGRWYARIVAACLAHFSLQGTRAAVMDRVHGELGPVNKSEEVSLSMCGTSLQEVSSAIVESRRGAAPHHGQ